MIKHIVDNALEGNLIIQGVLLFSGLFFSLALMQAFSAFIAGWGRSKTAENIIRDLRNRLFDHIQRLSFSYHDKMSSGELVQRSTSDVDMVRQFYSNQIPGLARILFMFIINFIAVFILDYRLALFAVSIIPVIPPGVPVAEG